MNGGEVRRVGASNDRREIVPQRGLDALHGLVRPGFDRHRLPPPLDFVFVRQPHHNRWAYPFREELEFADQIIVEPADFNANDPGHWFFTRRWGVSQH